MISLKSLMSAEEGRAIVSSSPTAAKSDDLGSWLSDYNKSKGGIAGAVQGASTSVSSLFSSFTSSATASSPAASTTAAAAASNPDVAPASSYSSWFSFGPAASASETAALTAPTTAPASTSASSSASGVSAWLPSLPGLSAIPGYGEDSSVCFGLSYHQRLALFFLSFCSGLLMLFLSFTFLPLLLLGAAAKFTLSYGLANVLFLMSSAFLTGPAAQLATMFRPERVVVSVCYIGSLLALMYAAWQVPTFVVVLPLCAVQVVCLLMYVSSYLPFGLPVMRRLFGVFWASMMKMVGVGG